MTLVAHGQPHSTGGQSVADIVEHLMDEFEHRLELHVIARVVLGCRADLDCSPAAALPELIERLARQRLLDTARATRDDSPYVATVASQRHVTDPD